MNTMTKYETSPYITVNSNRANVGQYTLFNYLNNSSTTINDNYYDLLVRCCTPQPYDKLATNYPREMIDSAINLKFLLKHDEVWKTTEICFAEIEIGTTCNWNCYFCPQSIKKAKNQIMEMTLFKEIVDKIVDYKKIRDVSFSSYNEPTLDPYFLERADYIKQCGLKLCLYTNGSGLDSEKLITLKKMGVIKEIYFNLPSLDSERFRQITGYTKQDHTLDMIQQAKDIGFALSLSVQSLTKEKKRDLKSIQDQWPDIPISAWPTLDRPRMLEGKPFKNRGNITFKGCFHIMRSLCIDVKGRIFLCCNDYQKVSSFDNVTNKSISDIIEGEAMQKQRQIVFGAHQADERFICHCCDVMKDNMSFSRFAPFIQKHKNINGQEEN